jgi:hypothetical protein
VGNENEPSSVSESDVQTFVLRIRVEEPATDSHEVRWVGQITNLLDQRSRYVRDLQDVVAFVDDYLQRMGITGR